MTKDASYDPNKPMQVGGQAVIEGVMMRSQNSVATAVRRSNGNIVVQYEQFKSLTEKNKILSRPIIRGGIILIEMLYLGIKSLNFSAEIAMKDEEAKNKKTSTKTKKNQNQFALILTLIVSLLIGIAVFFMLPLFLATELFNIEQTAFTFNLTTGIIRAILLIIYLVIISFMKDVKQVFRYHGAEHKSVFAYEQKAPLTPESANQFSRFHPRCGTSFLLIVILAAIVSFSILDTLILELTGYINLAIRLGTHLPLIPLVGGIAYEGIKFSTKYGSSWWGKIAITPGLWLQKITTKEPDIKQIEVALVALKCALGQDNVENYTINE